MENYFKDLSNYKKKEGDCNAPKNYPGNPQLGPWATVQRACRREKKLSKEHIVRLTALGVKWSVSTR